MKKIINNEVKPVYFNKAIELGYANDNTLMIQRAYLKNIIAFSNAGYHEYSNKLYELRMELVKKEKTPIRQVHMHNGLGYGQIITEQHEMANENFNNAIDILLHLSNNTDMVETLYNMSVNAYMAGDFESAVLILELVFKILRITGMLSVQFCNASKLYGMMALSSYYSNKLNKSIIYLEKMEPFLSHLVNNDYDEEVYSYWYEDLFLYYILKGLLFEKFEKLEVANEFMEKAGEYLQKIEGNKFIYYTTYTIERVRVLRKLEREDEAVKLLNIAIDYSEKNKFYQKKSILIDCLENKNISLKKLYCGIKNHTYLEIKQHAYNVAKSMQLKDCFKNIDFLDKWQDNVKLDNKTIETMINNAMVAINNSFGLDGGIFIRRHGSKWKILHSDYDEFGKTKMNVVVNYFSKRPNSFVVNRIDGWFENYKLLLSLFSKKDIISLIGVTLSENEDIKGIYLGYVKMRREFTNNKIIINREIIDMIKASVIKMDNGYTQFIRRQEIDTVNKKLQMIAINDNLTGVYNRQGLKEKISELSNPNSQYNQGAVLYMDLDNFKYFNDTFGHDLGDDVLVVFANVVKKSVSSYGFVVRYGGDEFLAILPNVNKEEVDKILESIYKNCEDGIYNMIYADLGKVVQVSRMVKIGCSIGVAMFNDYSCLGINNAISDADKALFEAKKNRKGRSIVVE